MAETKGQHLRQRALSFHTLCDEIDLYLKERSLVNFKTDDVLKRSHMQIYDLIQIIPLD